MLVYNQDDLNFCESRALILKGRRSSLLNLDRENNDWYAEFEETFLDGEDRMVVKQLGHKEGL